MQSVRIGENIASLRRQKGVTQEELAQYLGVSKPAVSKWESGQSYPDILLLPLIAAYFSKSVDDLLGYEAQMTPQDVRRLYLSLAGAFAKEPFEAVHARCREAVKTYYSCWRLLFAMAQLLLNHAALAGGPEKTSAVCEEAAGLFERVEKESGDPVLARQALCLRAYCFLALQRPAEAIDLLGEIEELPISDGQLLAKAYAMKKDVPRAKEALQKVLYQNLMSLFGAFPDLILLYADEPERMEGCLQKALALGEVFGLKEMHPALYFPLYLTAAALYAGQNQAGRALSLLEEYAGLATRKDVFPLKLRGNEFFDRLEPYIETFNLGSHPPRSDALIRRDIRALVAENPAFASLKNEERFRLVVRKLEHLKEETP